MKRWRDEEKENHSFDYIFSPHGKYLTIAGTLYSKIVFPEIKKNNAKDVVYFPSFISINVPEIL